MGIVFDCGTHSRLRKDLCFIGDSQRYTIRNDNAQGIAIHRGGIWHSGLGFAVRHRNGGGVKLQGIAEGIHNR